MIWRVADFSGVEVLTYAVDVEPLPRAGAGSGAGGDAGRGADASLPGAVIRSRPPTRRGDADALEKELEAGGPEAEAFRRRLLARMGDVLGVHEERSSSAFRSGTTGAVGATGRSGRSGFKSVLVEGRGNPLQTMAAYIDLNGVRAGLAKDPKDYRFCGYAEAVAGRARAREGACGVSGRATVTGRSVRWGRGRRWSGTRRLNLRGGRGRTSRIDREGRP